MPEEEQKAGRVVINAPSGNRFALSIPVEATQEEANALIQTALDGDAENVVLTKFNNEAIDHSPTKGLVLPDPSSGYQTFRKRPVKEQQPHEEDVTYNAAAEDGVDIHTGAPAGIRAHADLMSLQPQAAKEAIEYLVAEDMKKQGITLPKGIASVFTESNTGKMAYYRPTEDGRLKKTLINAVGVDTGDALMAVDDVIGGVVEGSAAVGAGLVAGTATGGNPVAAGGAGTAAAGAANLFVNKMRKEVARSMGLPDRIVDKITGNDMLVDAAITMGYEVGGPIAVGAVRGVRNFTRPLSSTQDAKALGDQTRKVMDINEQ